MENLLNVAIIQADIIWEDSSQNRVNFSTKIDEISNNVDLIILQEMFTTGYTMNVGDVAETMTGDTVAWMLEKAKQKDALLMGSVIIKENGNYFNRIIVAFPSGKLEYYDKRHLFSYAGEDKVFTAGINKNIIKYKGWKLLPLVCYDIRFPIWSRNTDGYDVLIYVASWPSTRVTAWDTLLKARAIENLSYTIGVNRLGEDGNGIKYVGHSAVIDTLGNAILEFDENQEATKTITLNKNHIIESRNKFGFLNDMDQFKIV